MRVSTVLGVTLVVATSIWGLDDFTSNVESTGGF